MLLAIGVLVAGLAANAAAQPEAPAEVLGGALLPEGAPWNSASVRVLVHPGDVFVLDLGETKAMRALLVQADGNDVYFVETSENGARWQLIWRVPKAYGAPGLRTRTTVLDPPAQGRFVRMRATAGDGAFSIARVQVHAQVPRPWPPALDRSLVNSTLPLLPGLEPSHIRVLFAAVATAAVTLYALLLVRDGDRRLKTGLAVVSILSLAAFYNFFNFRYHSFTHFWEVYHYYVGAKYFPELRHDLLYFCTAVADAEDGLADQVRQRRMRDLTTNQIIFAATALEHPDVCRRRFTETRWAAFRRDIGSFRRSIGHDWEASQMDHGYNATPVWTVAGRIVSSLVPATPAGITLLASLDVLLLAAMFAVIYRVFGFEAACAAAVFFGLNAFARFAWTGGALLRYDWLLWSVIGVAALRRQRLALAGFAMTYAALLRIFPGVLFAGVGLLALAQAAREGSFAPLWRRSRFGAGVLLGLALLLPAGAVASGGFGVWRDFLGNSRKYMQTEASNRIGLETVVAYRHDLRQEMAQDPLDPDTMAQWTRGQAETVRRRQWLLLALQVALVAGIVVAVTRYCESDWVAAVIATALLPVLLKMGNYYYSVLTLAATLVSVYRPAGFGLVVLGWASLVVSDLLPALDQRSAGFSALIVAFVLTLITNAWRRRFSS